MEKEREITIPLGKNGGGGKGEREVSVLECGGTTVKEQRKSDWLAPRRLGVIWGKNGPL